MFRAFPLPSLPGMPCTCDPRWTPLLAFAPERVADFMWMYALELEDGTTLQAYKHRWTRRYLFLDAAARAFAEVRPGAFAEADAPEDLDEALRIL